MAHEAYKQLSDETLDGIFQSVDFITKPMHHQKATWAWAVDGSGRAMIWHDIGTGKSYCALGLADLWHCKRVLIVCPNSLVRKRGWLDQIRQHATGTATVLCGTKDQRMALQQTNSRFHIINYEGLKVLWGRKVEERVNGRAKGKWVPDPLAVAKTNYDLLIVDESHHIGQPDSLQTRIVFGLARATPLEIEMTGTPIGKDEQDLWAQYYALDFGATLGTNFFGFRNRYFHKIDLGRGRVKWVVRKGAREEILERITPLTMRYEASECVDLPKRIDQCYELEMSARQRSVYNNILEGLVAEFNEGRLTPKTIESASVDLYRACSGFGRNDADQLTEIPGQNPKIEQVREILRATAMFGQKVLICHNFIYEGRMLETLCRRMGLKFSAMRGEVADKEGQYEKFIQPEGDTNVLIFHPQSAGEGLNLQVANHLIFFSFAFLGTIMRQQVIGRIVRAGQTKTCTIHDLLVVDSVEEYRYENLQVDVALSTLLLDYIRGEAK